MGNFGVSTDNQRQRPNRPNVATLGALLDDLAATLAHLLDLQNPSFLKLGRLTLIQECECRNDMRSPTQVASGVRFCKLRCVTTELRARGAPLVFTKSLVRELPALNRRPRDHSSPPWATSAANHFMGPVPPPQITGGRNKPHEMVGNARCPHWGPMWAFEEKSLGAARSLQPPHPGPKVRDSPTLPGLGHRGGHLPELVHAEDEDDGLRARRRTPRRCGSGPCHVPTLARGGNRQLRVADAGAGAARRPTARERGERPCGEAGTPPSAGALVGLCAWAAEQSGGGPAQKADVGNQHKAAKPACENEATPIRRALHSRWLDTRLHFNDTVRFRSPLRPPQDYQLHPRLSKVARWIAPTWQFVAALAVRCRPTVARRASGADGERLTSSA